MRPSARRAVGLALFVAALSAGDARGKAPPGYAKRGTWLETMIATRQRMAREAAKQPAAPTPLPDFGRGNYTVMAWVRTRSDGTIFAKAPERGQWVPQGKSLFLRGGRVTFDVGWVGDVRARTRVADGKWHHVALVSRGPRREIYVDGALSADGSLDAKRDRKDWPLKVGQTAVNFGGAFRGRIDEFRIYARAMRPDDVKARSGKRPPDDDVGLVLYWPLDGDCTDASGSRNSASEAGGCAFAAGKWGQALRLDGSGRALLRPGGTSPAEAVWSRLAADFPDEVSRREMAWEAEDGIWAGDWRAVSFPAVAARYARAVRRPSALAEQIAGLAARAEAAANLPAVRKLYLRWRRHEELLKHVAQYKLGALRQTIAATYRDAAKRRELLGRLDGIEGLAASWHDGPPDGAAMERWKADVARLRRDALIDQNPLIDFDSLLFIKRYTFQSSHFYTDFIDGCANYGGNLCVLHLKTGKVTDLIPEMKNGIFDRFDLHFSARRIAFNWKRSAKEGFRIYEIDIDPARGVRIGGPRQLTFPPDDEQARIAKYAVRPESTPGPGPYYHQTDDMHPCYLPDGGIAFTSTRCEYGTLCDGPDILSTAVIYRMDGDGKNMEKLTNSPVSEFCPTMLPDGRILYTRWEYVDKGQLGVKCLWAMCPDGSATVEVYGNDIALPPSFMYGRPVPGEQNVFVFTGAPHYPQGGSFGTIIRIDMSRNIRTREPMTYVTPHVDVRQEPGWNQLRNGRWVRDQKGPLYTDPYPLSKHLFLVAHNPDKHWKDLRAYGLYLIDDAGGHELIYKDDEFTCREPFPLRPRKVPPIIPSQRDAELAKKRLAVCFVQDIYRGLAGIERGEVKYIRIMEQIPRPWDCRRFWDPRNRYDNHTHLISHNTALGGKAMWGVVPVEDDGSAHFYVPADRNIYFQALDANYMELQRERTYVNYRPGERRSCVTCHDTPNQAPRAALTGGSIPTALRRDPSEPQAQPGDDSPRQVLHYPTYVQPVLDKYCVTCHGGQRPKAGLDLTGELTTHFSRSYEALVRMVNTPREASDFGGTAYMPPKSIGSHASRLMKQVRAGCPGMDVKLPEWAFVRLATWVDAAGIYYGSYWGRRNTRFKDHPYFRIVPTFEQAIGTKAPVPYGER